MIRVHQNKRKATKNSNEEAKDAQMATKSSKLEKHEDACEEKAISACTAAALRILQSGANSSMMLREKLRRKGYDVNEIRTTLAELSEAGLLNDCRLLFAHAEFLAARKYYGKRRVYLELLRKFDRPLVDTYFNEAVEEIDFSACCTAFAKKNRGKDKNALAAKLSRQGYAAGEICHALSLLSCEQEEDYS